MSEFPIVWRAQWIWAPPPPRAPAPIAATAAVPPELCNRFCHLRRVFTLDRVPARVPARVTADSRFILYVNGIETARGPSRSLPARLSWRELDLAPSLHPGRNAICALVRFYGVPVPWWIPAPPNHQLGYGSFAFEAPEIAIASDTRWRARMAAYRGGIERFAGLPVPPVEILDGEQAPHGWLAPDFDDGSWSPAVELRAGTLATNRTRIPLEPYSAPEHDDVAALAAIPVAMTERSRRTLASAPGDDPRAVYPPLAPAAGDDTATTFDAGHNTLATPWVEARGPLGAIVDVYAGEDLRADGLADPAQRAYALRYRMAGRGGLERVEGFESVGLRYLTVIARGGARVVAAGAIERRYPRESAAAFECDQERLNKIWQIGVRTLELCSTDAFLDCPSREQRAWLGDSYIHTLLTCVAASDWRLARRHLRICAHGARGDGLLGMVAAGDFAIVATTIPDYSLHWIRALARYYEYSGDRETVAELMPAAAGVVAAFERYRAPDGLIRGMPGWVFIDWAMTERSEVVGALDALFAAALRDYAMLCAAIAPDSSHAAMARRGAERTAHAFELLWDEARGVYVDAADERGAHRRVSQHTNAAAIVAGCAPRERWARMLDYILDADRLVITPTIHDDAAAYRSQRLDPAEYVSFDAESDVVAAQPFFSHFVHQAVALAGRRAELPELCLRWWPQIQRGNSTFEEYWTGPPGGASRCHAWSATPTFDLTTHALGVQPLAPGYARAAIRPCFGPLTRLAGRVPTPHGMIEIELERARGGTINLPAGVTAQVEFDDAALLGGALSAGSHRIVAK